MEVQKGFLVFSIILSYLPLFAQGLRYMSLTLLPQPDTMEVRNMFSYATKKTFADVSVEYQRHISQNLDVLI